MNFFKKLLGKKGEKSQFSKEERRVMQQLQQQIPGSSLPTEKKPEAPKSVAATHAGATLTKPVPQSFVQQAQAEKRERTAEMERRQQMRASGMKQNEIANTIAQEKAAEARANSPFGSKRKK